MLIILVSITGSPPWFKLCPFQLEVPPISSAVEAPTCSRPRRVISSIGVVAKASSSLLSTQLSIRLAAMALWRLYRSADDDGQDDILLQARSNLKTVIKLGGEPSSLYGRG